ncbi:unnamed protein product [Penicillium nalgiovense]|nr:unnamed protein product [Penicillium nalgiovense]
MVVVSQNIIRSVLVTILLLLNFGRLFLLYCIQPRWRWYKVDLALCAFLVVPLLFLLGCSGATGFQHGVKYSFGLHQYSHHYKRSSLVGTFLLKSAHLGSLYILFADYLCVVAWYWWLFQQSTAGRAKLRCISCHLSAMALLLLVIAVIGTLERSWMIALEVELVIIAIWASSLQSIP